MGRASPTGTAEQACSSGHNYPTHSTLLLGGVEETWKRKPTWAVRYELLKRPVLCSQVGLWGLGQALSAFLLPPSRFRCGDLSTNGSFHPAGRREHGQKTRACDGRREGAKPSQSHCCVSKAVWSAVTNAWIWATASDFPGCEGEGLGRQLDKIICVILLKAKICLMLMAFIGSTEVILMEL